MVRKFLARVYSVGVISLSMVLYISPPVFAAQIGTSGSGLSFSCSVDTGFCTCSPTWDSADCKAMKKNCSDTAGHYCTSKNGTTLECGCKMALRKPTSPVTTAPSGGMRLQTQTKAKQKQRFSPKTRRIKTAPVKNTSRAGKPKTRTYLNKIKKQ